MLEKIIHRVKKSLLMVGFCLAGASACGNSAGSSYSPVNQDAGIQKDAEITCVDNDNDTFYASQECGSEIDCDDENNGVFPGAIEFCDYKDNNCDGQIDEGAGRTVYRDSDEDAFGDKSMTAISCLTENELKGPELAGYVYNPDDCDDNNENINPAARELCDDVDHDCDGNNYNGFNVGELCSAGIGECETNGEYICLPDGSGTICNAVASDSSEEECDGLDNDCDNLMDNNLIPPSRECSRGIGECERSGLEYKVCRGIEGWSAEYSGCDAVPGEPAAELCDNLDNDCNRIIDDGGNALCNDGLNCNGGEVCEGDSGCLPGTNIDCSENNIGEISRCNYIPDSLSGTWDFRPASTSLCEETTGAYRCTMGDFAVSHACNIILCDAECETNDDCPPTNCNSLDGCYEGTFRDYVSVNNVCLPDCNCTTNSCEDYIEAITDEDEDGYDLECDNDCDDTRSDINPGIEEIIDGIDNDCDGIIDPSRWLQVSAGYGHTCAILSDTSTFCWGWNHYGQLGDGTTVTPYLLPTLVPEINGAIDIELGSEHSCVVLEGDVAECWGRNLSGMLGNGNSMDQHSPVVVGLGGIVQIALARQHTCGLHNGGTVYCWGGNYSGQLGDGTADFDSHPEPTRVLGLRGGIQVDVGWYHNCALLEDNTVQCWGSNGQGNLGLGDSSIREVYTPTPVPGLSDIIEISLGSVAHHTCALRSNGTVYCWGDNLFGQLGDGTTEDRYSPTLVNELTDAVQIAVGQTYSCAVLEGGTVKCWGWNLFGELGDGTRIERHTPVDVAMLDNVIKVTAGSQHTCALLNNGTIWCWGWNHFGQLGDGTTWDHTLPTPIDW